MSNGESLEEFAYSALLANENLKRVHIERNYIMTGITGIKHEFDVYYEIYLAGICHKVAIECKQLDRPVEKGKVQEFESKVRDCNNIIGCMVSSNGYQSGAKAFAQSKGILTLTPNDLPSIYEITASCIKFMLPDERTTAEPFWTIMETNNGKNTGTYVSFNGSIILFISRKAAEKAMLASQATQCKVFGITKKHLSGICLFSQTHGIRLSVCPLLSSVIKIGELVVYEYTYQEIEKEFLS
ncbi:MAG: restriction endonuclease [Oscillospiraceae bacterium]|jgi:hypothetical protein|nr:restriction endonuclease [Oscillospiraceae bacterium]